MGPQTNRIKANKKRYKVVIGLYLKEINNLAENGNPRLKSCPENSCIVVLDSTSSSS